MFMTSTVTLPARRAHMAVGDVVTAGHIYERALYNSEVVGNYRAYLADPDYDLADRT